MPKKTLPYVLFFLLLVSAFFSWQSVSRAIFSESASDFWVPFLCFSFFVITLSLSIVLVRAGIASVSIFFLSLALSFFFVQSPMHFVAVAVAWALIFVAQKNIRTDIEMSIKIHLMKSLHRGMFLIVVALVLMISSQYYFSIKTLDENLIIPKINKSEMTDVVVNFILSYIDPQFKQVKNEDLTVDEFFDQLYETVIKKETDGLKNKTETEAGDLQISQTEKILEEELGRKLTEDEKKQLSAFKSATSATVPVISPQIKQNVIDEWKKEFSKVAGFNMKGDEYIADIFVVIVNSKINEIATPQPGAVKSSILPIVLTILLFLTLVPTGSFVSRLWIGVSAGIFWLLRKAELIIVETEIKEAEVIR